MEKTKKETIRTGRSLTWQEREKIVKEFLTGNYTKVALWKKYTGQEEEHGQILRWMRMLACKNNNNAMQRQNLNTLQQKIPETLSSNTTTQDPLELQRRIKELEKQLESAQLQLEGYELMIEIAEKELKQPIRKKFDTK